MARSHPHRSSRPQKDNGHSSTHSLAKPAAQHRGATFTNQGLDSQALFPPRPKPYRNVSGAGAEPGVNPRYGLANVKYGHFKQECVIDVVDYSTEKAEFKRLHNEGLIGMMKDEGRDVVEDGVKRVRWINIGGIDWGVMSAVALRYNLHSLALEDVIHEQGHNQSKADYYHAHLFLRILCHSLEPEEDAVRPDLDLTSEFPSSNLGSIPPSGLGGSSHSSAMGFNPQQPEQEDDTDSTLKVVPTLVKRRLTGLSGFRGVARQEQELRLQALTKGDRVNVRHEPMFIFLLRDGTVISVHPTPTLHYTEPITERLHQHDSVLRTSADPSLLVESLLDLIVDRVLEVMDQYQDRIHKLEHDILIKPRMNTVRSLHILSGDLIMHKRTLEPIKTMLYGLRRYDVDRCIALADGFPDVVAENKNGSGSNTPRSGNVLGVKGPNDGKGGGIGVANYERESKVEGYLSYTAKVYLADVYDHMDFALTSLDMFAGISENLINYAFNMASYEMNQVMQRLTLATIIFLPLTLLTGYFGMNFQRFWSINNNSDLFFWIIALPLMGVLIPLFTYGDIKEMVHSIQKRMATRRAVKRYRYT